MTFEFEWQMSEPDETGSVTVRERLCGTDLMNHYTVPNKALAEAVIKTRRAFVHRTVTSRLQATKIFNSPRNLIQ